jgi:uncharacterized protein YrrD
MPPSSEGGQGEQPFQRSSFDREYWLGHCEGFRVEVNGRRLGVVEQVIFDARTARPDSLIVRRGLFRFGITAVPVLAVADVIPSRKLLTLTST